ncbi:hypothetical protein ACIA98_42335 [Streptomyces sp. NPDC051366]|uniref:hypothetical protein n=1 Tax=Streptomyces sp. NPDC051366 TaxID=3365652 RepID=UPI003789E26C
MNSQEYTDVWFRTYLPLEDIAAALDAPVRTADGENYWEWVIADLAGIDIDITRTHTTAPENTDTRIFRVGHPTGGREIPEHTLHQIVAGLQRAGVDPVYLGEWKYLDGNEFDHVVHKMITWRAPHPDSDA